MASKPSDTATPRPGDAADGGMRKGLTSYGDAGFSLFLRKAFIKGAGYTDSALDRPVIGITDTGSGYNPCHGNMPQLVEAVQRGILMAGGLPVSEILRAPGVDFAGTIPEEIQLNQTFSIAVVAGSTQGDAAKRLIAFLTSPAAAGAIRRSGMKPLGKNAAS